MTASVRIVMIVWKRNLIFSFSRKYFTVIDGTLWNEVLFYIWKSPYFKCSAKSVASSIVTSNSIVKHTWEDDQGIVTEPGRHWQWQLGGKDGPMSRWWGLSDWPAAAHTLPVQVIHVGHGARHPLHHPRLQDAVEVHGVWTRGCPPSVQFYRNLPPR